MSDQSDEVLLAEIDRLKKEIEQSKPKWFNGPCIELVKLSVGCSATSLIPATVAAAPFLVVDMLAPKIVFLMVYMLSVVVLIARRFAA